MSDSDMHAVDEQIIEEMVGAALPSQQDAIRTVLGRFPECAGIRSAVFQEVPYRHQFTDAREYAEMLERRIAFLLDSVSPA